MADLDNFFAKRDRKKSKSVKKFATADELAKKLDEPKQKTDVKPKKERPVQEGEEARAGVEEEEWKEYEEPVKDYTGLKIQVLQGGNGTPESSHDSTTEGSVPDNGKVKGPWNKPVEQPEQAAPPPPAPVEEKPRETAKYVPPSRLAQRPTETQKRNVSKNAPDIHNDDYFPVLGASAKRGGVGGWSTAGGGGQPARGAAHKQPLALGNRFTSLQDDS